MNLGHGDKFDIEIQKISRRGSPAFSRNPKLYSFHVVVSAENSPLKPLFSDVPLQSWVSQMT